VIPLEHRGRLLFGQELTFAQLSEMMGNQPKIKKTKLTKEFNYKTFQALHGNAVIPLFVLKPDGSVQACTVDGFAEPEPGDLVFSIVRSLSE
jgi:CPA1 family monovalent cation:H+ antiporter